jgi:hypothetical protein
MALKAFAVTNDWQESHAYAARKFRCALTGQTWRRKLQGIAVARLTQMVSIRRKLKTIPDAPAS